MRAGSSSVGGDGAPSRWLRGSDVLRDARVLVVEDEILVAALLEERLESLGCQVIGPASSVGEALDLLRAEADVDAAVLDVNLGGEKVFPVADMLAEREIPFLFATAYGASGVDRAHNERAVLDKPYHERALEHALRSALQSRRRR